MHKTLHPKADVERLYITRKGLIDVETAFKTATIGLGHYLKHKEGQYPKQALEHERSKGKKMVFRSDIFRKLTLSAPDDLYCFCASAVHSATRRLTVSTLSPHILSTPGKHFDCQ